VTTKEALHQLVDEHSESQLQSAHVLVERLRDSQFDPVLLAMLTAPLDDEPETEEERAGVAEARAEAARGELIDDDLVL
jgi:hypothetical protein